MFKKKDFSGGPVLRKTGGGEWGWRMIAYGKWCRIPDLQRRFSFGTRDQAQSRAFVQQSSIEVKKGQKKLLAQASEKGLRVPPMLLLAAVSVCQKALNQIRETPQG